MEGRFGTCPRVRCSVDPCGRSAGTAKGRAGLQKLSQNLGNSRKSGTAREDTAHGALTPPSQRKRALSFRAVESALSHWACALSEKWNGQFFVIPAKAGIQSFQHVMDFCLRRGSGGLVKSTD
jgi:hypothetical protein